MGIIERSSMRMEASFSATRTEEAPEEASDFDNRRRASLISLERISEVAICLHLFVLKLLEIL